MAGVDHTVDRYLLLGLRLGRHVDGLVDFFYGPEALRTQVEGEAVVPAVALVVEAAELLQELGDASAWLREQVEALHVYARVLAGEPIAFADEVEGCYRVRPEHTPEEVLADAHDRLETLLPGSGTLAERFKSWREQRFVPPEKFDGAFNSAVGLLRDWTASFVELPAGDDLELETVTGEPWAAFNYYSGGLHSRIAVNVELPSTVHELLVLAAHETYPGHHAEHALKESLLVRGRGLLEESTALVPTPQALVSEGIAMHGEQLALRAVGAELTAALMEHGLHYDAEESQAVGATLFALRGAGNNVALMLHEHGASHDEARAYLQRWRLLTREQAEQSIAFLTDPTWRAYASTYTWGRRLCEAWVGDDLARLARLLCEQVAVSELKGEGVSA